MIPIMYSHSVFEIIAIEKSTSVLWLNCDEKYDGTYQPNYDTDYGNKLKRWIDWVDENHKKIKY